MKTSGFAIKKLIICLLSVGICTAALSQERLSKRDYLKDYDLFQSLFEQVNSGLYRYHPKEKVDSLFRINRQKITESTSYRDFYNLVWEVIDFTGSIHNNLDYPDSLKIRLNREKIFFPLPLRYLEKKLIVNADFKDLKTGDEILSINGIEAQDFAKTVGHYRSTDGYNTTEKYAFIQTKKLADYIYYAFGKQDEFLIHYQSNGKNKQTILPAVAFKTFEEQHKNRFIPEYEEEEEALYFFRFLEGNIGYLRVSSFAIGVEGSPEYKTFSAFLEYVFKDLKYHKSKNLIVDIRGNAGGIDPNESLLFAYMTDRKFKENTSAYTLTQKFPFPEQLRLKGFSLEELEEAAKERHNDYREGKYFQNQEYNPVWSPKENRFTGNLYMLIDPFVASAASHYAAMVKSDRKAVVVGQETGGGYYGHTGHYNITYQLPETGLLLSFSVVNFEQDVRELPDQKQGQGIMPDHEVQQTIEGYLNHTDKALEYIKRLIKNENR